MSVPVEPAREPCAVDTCGLWTENSDARILFNSKQYSLVKVMQTKFHCEVPGGLPRDIPRRTPASCLIG